MRASAGILVVLLAVMLGSSQPSAQAGAGVPGIQVGSTRKVTKSQVEADPSVSSDSGAATSPKATTELPAPTSTPRTPSSGPTPAPKRDSPGIGRPKGSPVTTKKVTKKTGGRPASTATLAR